MSVKSSASWRGVSRRARSRQDLLTAMVSWASWDLWGEVRDPRNEEESDALKGKLSAIPMGILEYRPHAKQDWFHRAQCRTKLFLGSNQSGKTTGMLAEILSWCLGFHPWDGTPVLHPVTGLPVRPPIRAMIGAEDYVTSHQETILPKMFELLPQAPFVERMEKIQGRTIHKLEFYNGSTIKLMSYESSEGKWEGPTYHIAAFDEPPPRPLYVATKRGLMRYQGPCLFSMTPLKEPWIHDELYVSEDAVHVQSAEDLGLVKRKSFFVTTVSLDDNPYLTQEAKETFLLGLDEEEREARQFGRFRHLMGRVYKRMDPDIHVLDEERFQATFGDEWRDWPAALVVDPHDRKPFAMAWCVVSPRNEIIWVHEWPEFDFYATKAWHWGVPEYTKRIGEIEEELGLTNVFWRIMDPNFGRSPKAGMGGQTLQQEFDDAGLWFDCNVDNDLASGHVQVREWLGNTEDAAPRMFFRSCCTNMVRGMLSYTWDDYKAGIQQGRSVKEAVKDKFKDFPDLVRYAVKGGVEYLDPDSYRPRFRQIVHGGLG